MQEFCAVIGCGRNAKKRNLCVMHYKRFLRNGTLKDYPATTGNSKCLVINCTNKHFAKNLCRFHYHRKFDGKVALDAPLQHLPAGSGTITEKGYKKITVNGKLHLEHRYVYEQYLGRSLTKDENIHHKNGNRTDNRLENLELWNTSQPSGQRPEDKIAYAKEILAQYGDLEQEDDAHYW